MLRIHLDLLVILGVHEVVGIPRRIHELELVGLHRGLLDGVVGPEAMLEVRKQHKQLYIGIPKETSFQENRVPLIPDSVALLTNHGHEIVIEAGAGAASKIEDSDFSEAGAKIAYSTEEV